MTNPIVIGIDAGGTMTDTILVDEHGHFKIGKAATTPKNEADGFLSSAEDAAEAWGISLDDLFSGVNVVLYSGTGMLNTLLSRTGRRLGLITTKGLEDMILMGRGLQTWADYSYADRLHAITHHHPDPLVPRKRTHGVTERVDQFGDVIIPLYEKDVVKAVKALIKDKVDSICIMTIFSHVNPVHEKRIAEIARAEIKKAGAGITVYTSHEVRPVIREQSRLNSVLIEAYATSRGRQQLKGIEDISKKYGFKYGVQTLLSFGGLTSINHPRLHETMISGPIGGILGAVYVGKLIGNDSLVCSDMGGTSFDMGVITRGQTRIENEPIMDRFKLNVPTLHLDTIGAGAGMIIKVDPLTKKVSLGPESAGSDPGPICFNRGGTEPTIADCDAILGRLNPNYFLGGKVKLDVEKATRIFKEKCADVLGVEITEAAEGMIDMLEQDANAALRRVISGQGIHPSQYTLLSYGGSGPLHLAGCSKGTGFKDIITFQFAAAFSAFGCTTADYMRRHSVSTQIDIPSSADDKALAAYGKKISAIWHDLERAAVDEMLADGHAREKVKVEAFLMMRYTGQLEDVEVKAPLSVLTSADDMRRTITQFEEVYAKINHRVSRYGAVGFSVMELGLTATADKVKPTLEKRPLGKSDPAAAHKGTRQAYIGGRWHEANLYEMDRLQPGHEIKGPAIVEHPATTLVVHPNDTVFVDEWTLLHYIATLEEMIMNMHEKIQDILPLRDRLLESELMMKETGCYDGVTELTLRKQDPLKFETLHTKLRASCVSAREMARRISASPGVREVGEMVVAIYTPEGDAIALSNGIMVHVHTMSRFIKWMIKEGYEANPGIKDGDIFANNDAFIGTVQVPDVMDVIPIFHGDELVGWAGAVCHELESGGITPGGDVCLAQERFTEGLFVCAEKIGENDEIRRDYVIRCERNLRMPIYWVLDEKAKVASCIDMRESVRAIIAEIGIEYWRRVMKEFIEEGRRGQLLRTQQLTVPGIYRGHTFYGHVTEGKPGFQPLGPSNWLYNIPIEMEITTAGKIIMDFEGTQPWGYHSMNCTPAGMDGGMFVTLTQHMNFEGLVNDGAWMATELKLPHGTWTNPDNEMVATATSWALLLPAYGVFQRLLSRGFLARGFVEEVFVGQVNSPMIEMGGESQYGTSFGMAHFECAAAGSGALAIKDGLDTAYVGWNPESDMGNIEIWEQNMPMLYIGRSILPNSGGAGKYRGGCSFISTWLINKTNHLRLVTSEHSSRVFDNAGMCGGYPAPTCQMHRAVRKTNIKELIKKQKPLPHGIGIDPDHSDLEKLVKGVHETSEGPYITAPHKSGDIFTHAYNGGGGFGDVLERDPIKTASDVENGFLTAQVAHQVFGIVLVEDREGTLKADLAVTVKLRKSMRAKRLKKSIPVSQWMKNERKRVSAGRFVIEVTRMYASAMKLSKRFTKDFNSFWGLKPGFTYKVED